MPPDSTLPDLLLITPEPPRAAGVDLFLDRLSHAVASGIALVQLRAKTLDMPAYLRLASEVCAVCHRHGARVVLNGPLDGWDEGDADGLHLPSARLMQTNTRPPRQSKLLSAACHSPEQLLHAQRIGVDFVTLSPVLPTTSHPGEPTLGWAQFESLAAMVSIPVFALGGMTRELAATARTHGAHGMAGISAFW
ncbi:thiamine phosphate synthase [Trinickia dinghuensis]|uniref:Thiamine phosphate synthase n=1 Tax=Trinickia dinghuensis TaxID=2291023 RepID=A0A3D8JQS0_9BURK|nr:thiamine phosphate synthase [Trinickia dinghuensis]RDU95055.1 thiamine phosphate synthase [Trinickia dinghuensis]